MNYLFVHSLGLNKITCPAYFFSIMGALKHFEHFWCVEARNLHWRFTGGHKYFGELFVKATFNQS